MSDSIYVFKERRFHFGLFQRDVERCIPFDRIWISPSASDAEKWKFESKNGKLNGALIHLGCYLKSSLVHFSHRGSIFVVKLNDKSFCGIFTDNIVLRIRTDEENCRILNYCQIKRYPPGISLESYLELYKYRRKTIFVIDPVRFGPMKRQIR